MADPAERGADRRCTPSCGRLRRGRASLVRSEAWQRIGATPMIGQNDVPARFRASPTRTQLVAFARHHHLRPALDVVGEPGPGLRPQLPRRAIVSDQCSGVDQAAGGFADVFERFTPSTRPADRPPTDRVRRARRAGAAPSVERRRPGHLAVPDLERRAGATRRTPRSSGTTTSTRRSGGPRATCRTRRSPTRTDTPWTLLGPVLPGRAPGAHADAGGRHLPDVERRRGSTRAATGCCYHGSATRPSGGPRATRPTRHVSTPDDSPWQQLDELIGRWWTVSPGRSRPPGARRSSIWRMQRQRLRVRHQRALAQPARAGSGRPRRSRCRSRWPITGSSPSTSTGVPGSTTQLRRALDVRREDVACVGWWKSSRSIRPRSVAISARREDHDVIEAVIVASAPPG